MSGIIFVLVCIALYFVPAFYAYHVKHPKKESILILNLFLGWTFLGWVIAAVWSANKIKETNNGL